MLSNNLEKLRKQNKITQKDFAKELGVPYTTYNAYELSKSIPTLDTLIKIADYFNVSLDYLVGRNFQGGLSTDEYELINMYRQLIEPEQKRIMGFLEFETSLKENLKENNN